jgi:hypothetical protein
MSPRCRRVLAAAISVVGLLAASCGPPVCPPIKTSPPTQTSLLPWPEGRTAVVEARNGDTTGQAILDSAFDFSSVGAAPGQEPQATGVTLNLGDAAIGPGDFGAVTINPPIIAILGNDVLHQLPMVHDPAARTTELLPAFSAPSSGSVPLTFAPSPYCRNDVQGQGADGPFGYIVSAVLDGVRRWFVINTGAESTFVREEVLSGINDRPRLDAIFISSAFAGTFRANATRARSIAIGDNESQNIVMIAAPEVDAVLDFIYRRLDLTESCSLQGICLKLERLDGLLGWNFLREYRSSFAEGADAPVRRYLNLSRLPTQTHWTRDFVGAGLYTSFSQNPMGLRVDGFFPNSTGQTAGVTLNDLITHINDVAVTAPNPSFGPAGGTAKLSIVRGTVPTTVNVPVVDMLPNPP